MVLLAGQCLLGALAKQVYSLVLLEAWEVNCIHESRWVVGTDLYKLVLQCYHTLDLVRCGMTFLNIFMTIMTPPEVSFKGRR